MKIEVEQKFPVSNLMAVEQAARELGATEASEQTHIDQYFAHPVRDFARTDEALRIRRVGEANYVTYKGPKMDAATKTRRELELPLSKGASAADEFASLLEVLGFRSVATVRKRRRPFHLQRALWTVEIALDSVDEVGDFVELEIVASDAEVSAAQEALLKLAAELGLKHSERRSYLELLLTTRDAGS